MTVLTVVCQGATFNLPTLTYLACTSTETFYDPWLDRHYCTLHYRSPVTMAPYEKARH